MSLQVSAHFLLTRMKLKKFWKFYQKKIQKRKNAKSRTIQFGAIDHIEYEEKSFKFLKKSYSTVSNNSRKEYKHNPNKFLLGFSNVPDNLPVEILIRNDLMECIFWNCSNCGVHNFF